MRSESRCVGTGGRDPLSLTGGLLALTLLSAQKVYLSTVRQTNGRGKRTEEVKEEDLDVRTFAAQTDGRIPLYLFPALQQLGVLPQVYNGITLSLFSFLRPSVGGHESGK